MSEEGFSRDEYLRRRRSRPVRRAHRWAGVTAVSALGMAAGVYSIFGSPPRGAIGVVNCTIATALVWVGAKMLDHGRLRTGLGGLCFACALYQLTPEAMAHNWAIGNAVSLAILWGGITVVLLAPRPE